MHAITQSQLFNELEDYKGDQYREMLLLDYTDSPYADTPERNFGTRM